jgi:EmrB/QacA subfamily drug resistance transporter
MTATIDRNTAELPATGLGDRRLGLAFGGLLVAMFIGALDQTIMATALPTIAGQLGGLTEISWVVTAYVLAAAASTPLWGKGSDLFGRKRLIAAAILVFIGFSALSGTAQRIGWLIAFRALQGIGAGGVMTLATAGVADLVPPRERGRYQGYIQLTFLLASLAGPLLGGLFVDQLSWRWAFYVNVPIGAAALLVTGLGMRLHTPHIRARIDYWGAALLTVGVVSLTLVASWGGSEYPWRSAQIISLAVVSVVTLTAFVFAERRAVEPILPPRLFRNRNFTVAQILSFLVGAAMFGAVNFLPQYMQDVQGASATASGLLLLPLMFGMLIVMLAIGQLILRNGRYRIYPILGGAVLTAGMLLLTTLKVDTSTFVSSSLTLVAGLGMGFLMQNTTLITQNSVEMRDMGAASGSVTLFRTLGGSLGIALLGSIFTSRLKDEVSQRLGPGAGDRLASSHVPPSLLHRLPVPVRDAFEAGVTSGLHGTLIGGAVLAAIGFGVAFLIREVPLRGRGKEPVKEQEAVAEPVL